MRYNGTAYNAFNKYTLITDSVHEGHLAGKTGNIVTINTRAKTKWFFKDKNQPRGEKIYDNGVLLTLKSMWKIQINYIF